MGPHSTWFDYLPGYESLRQNFELYLGRKWTWQVFQPTHFKLRTIFGILLVVGFLTIGAVRYRGAVSGSGDTGLIPPPEPSGSATCFEMLADTIYGLVESVMGSKDAERFLPLIGSFFFFILFSNLLGLIPGFLPPTDTLKVNVALAGLVFVMTHVYGLRAHGIKYLKHFLGPWLPVAVLMLPIEIISHVARPVSLSMRLLGNIVADHKVAVVFFTLVPILVPVPFLVMGVFVSVVQAVVFSLLATICISTAIAHDEH